MATSRMAFGIGGTDPQNPASEQHGSMERNRFAGTVFGMGGPLGMTPPLSPCRSPSPRRSGSRRPLPADGDDDNGRDRDRDRERDRPRSPRPPAEEQPLPESWGARMLATETKLRELTESVANIHTVVEGINARANAKIEEVRVFVTDVEHRFGQLERNLPERIHQIEAKQASAIELINQLTFHLQTKFSEIESALKSRPTATSAPPIPPSFGGFGKTETFIGSPLSAPSTAQPNATQPEFDPWSEFSRSQSAYATGGLGPSQPAQAAGPLPNPAHAALFPTPAVAQPPAAPPPGIHRPWISKDWSAAEIKVAKELKPFSGSHAAYKIWASRVKDHFCKKNGDWKYLFKEVEAQKNPIDQIRLQMGYLTGDSYTFDVDFAWAANQIWTFVGENVVDTVYTNRSVLAGGTANGLELWRALYVKHEGGAVQVEIGGMTSLHSFPQCDKIESLQLWVGKWQETKDLYGAGISDAHLRTMFLNVLPPTVQREIREKPELTTLHSCISHVLSDLGRLNDASLSKLHMERLKSSLHAPDRVSKLIEAADEPATSTSASAPQPQAAEFTSFINALSEKLEHVVAAVNNRPRPKAKARPQRSSSDFAKFGDKCLHCGSDKHRARECPVKLALMERNNGKLPPNYKSAFDKWKEKQPKKVVSALMEDDDLDEYAETDLDAAWSMPQCAISAKSICGLCDEPNFEHSNPFAPIFDDDDDDEAKVLDAIRHFTPKITVGPKLSQKQRKSLSVPKPVDRVTVAQLAKLVRSGKMNLPDLDLESSDEYEAIWALVDSGAARSCAKRKAHFGNTITHLRPSHVRMATASGEELKSRGCFDLEALSAEGNSISQTFEDADVDMPIMAVGELSANGKMGSNVLFSEHNGHMIDVETDATSQFFRRRGVYFMKLFVRRNQLAERPDFHRPGAA